MLQLRMGENTVRFYKRVGGTYTQLGSDVATTLNANTVYQLKVVVQGSTLTTYVDNVIKQSVSDSSHVRGRVGVRSYGSAAMFDNLAVNPLQLFTDDFEDGNSTGWVVLEGVATWSVVTDGATKRYKNANATAVSQIAAAGSAWSNFQAGVTIKCDTDQTGDYPGFLFRCTDVNNFYMLQLRMGENTARLYKRVGGTYTQLGSDSATSLSAGTAHRVEIEAIGTTIRTYVDGVLKHNLTDATFSSGKIGVRSYEAPTAFDDLIVNAQ